jgi:hypothetical protein
MNIRFQAILIASAISLAIMGLLRPVEAMQNEAQQSIPAKGFTLVNTDKFSIQVPAGWSVGKETPWGARDITPKSGSGQMGAMTAGPTNDSWDALYKTSLYFIKLEEAGSETPYRTGKTKQGYDCMSFEVKNKDGFANRRYTLLKNAKGNVLALSIKIPTSEQERALKDMFQHMIDTAKIK